MLVKIFKNKAFENMQILHQILYINKV
jgi:hypothetical protein